METIFRNCAGLDVHKRTVQASVRRVDANGRVHTADRGFGTTTREILALGDWLEGHGVTHVAMESTGVYWKPLWNLLEGRFTLLLANAHQIKRVPGRKTDVTDAQWLAKLLQFGLVPTSLVPLKPVRQIRELTRERAQLVAETARVANRIQKVLEDANIKLSSVATDIKGVSCQEMIQALIRGEEDPHCLAEMARGRLRSKIPQLVEALSGRIEEHHRFLLTHHGSHLRSLGELLSELEARIDAMVAEQPGWTEAMQRLDQIPGVDRRTAQVILAETGGAIGAFPSDAHLASWAGMSPGNNESAGRRKSGKTTKGNRWLRTALVQAAWAASRTRDSYLRAQFQRIARRRGKKRAAVAVAHSLLVICWHLLKHGGDYQDLGVDYFDRADPERLKRRLVQRLEALGHHVTLQPREDAA